MRILWILILLVGFSVFWALLALPFILIGRIGRIGTSAPISYPPPNTYPPHGCSCPPSMGIGPGSCHVCGRKRYIWEKGRWLEWKERNISDNYGGLGA
jgi:hypothetical protein